MAENYSFSSFQSILRKSKIPKEKRQQSVYSPELNKPKSWGQYILDSPKFIFSMVPPIHFGQLTISPYNNDYNLSQEDLTTYDGKIDSTTVRNFLHRSGLDISRTNFFDIKPISKFMPFPSSPPLTFNVSPNLNEFDVCYLQVSLQSFGFHGKAAKLCDLKGLLFLFDVEKKEIVSEHIEFGTNKEGVILFPGKLTYANFLVRGEKKQLRLGCILLHHSASYYQDLVTSTTTTPLPVNIPIPLAFSYIDPFSSDSDDIQFHFPWQLLSNPNSLKKIFTSKVDKTIPILGKCNIKINTNPPAISPALPIHMTAYDPPPRIYVSKLSFIFNNAPKCDLIYFKCRAYNQNKTDDISSIIKSPSLTVFHIGDVLSDQYISSTLKSAKKVTFPNLIRLDFNSAPPPNLFLKFEVFAVNSEISDPLYTSFTPLFNEGDIMFGEQKFVVHTQNQYKLKEVLVKFRSTSKTGLKLTYLYHPLLAIPKCLRELSEAEVPHQIKWDEISKLPQQLLEDNFLPIAIKLIALISPISVPYLLDLIKRVPNSLQILNSWAFSSIKPKGIRPTFLSSFSASFFQWLTENFDHYITLETQCFTFANTNSITSYQQELNNIFEKILEFAKSFSTISTILLCSYYRKAENYMPSSVYSFFSKISSIIVKFGDKEEFQALNSQFGELVYILFSISKNYNETRDIMHLHIRDLLDAKLFGLIFEFFIPFTYSRDFAIMCAHQLPLIQLKPIMFSPFHPIYSILALSFSKTISSLQSSELETTFCKEPHQSSSSKAAGIFCQILARLCLPLDNPNVSPGDKFRAAFSMFPFLDVLSVSYQTFLTPEQQYTVLPAILFMLCYTPVQLLKNFFINSSPKFQNQIILFLNTAAKVCISHLKKETTSVNAVFDQLTQRILQFLMYNISEFKESLPSVITLLSTLAKSHFQSTMNFLRLFDVIHRIIFMYEAQRALVVNLLEIVESKQHYARCFAVSLILLFFKSDYDQRKSVVVSSVEVLDELTNLLLKASDSQIGLYVKMLDILKDVTGDYQDELLLAKITERMNAARLIADAIINLRKTAKSTEERSIFIMKIADQYKTFPSMRMKWLNRIVEENKSTNNYSSAFIAQIHICALIATVYEHEHKLHHSAEKSQIPEKNKFNLLIDQPIQNGRTENDQLDPTQDFSFIPSALVETSIDFSSLSEDFQFVANDFTLDLLLKEMDKAAELGKTAGMFYTVRCIQLLQLRLYTFTKNFAKASEVSEKLVNTYSNISALNSLTHDNSLRFFLLQNSPRIYCVDKLYEPTFFKQHENVQMLEFYPFEPNCEWEHCHCWNIFRTKPDFAKLKQVKNATNPEIKIYEYKTKEELPRFTMFSDFEYHKDVEISLAKYIELEFARIMKLVNECNTEFEKCFPIRDLKLILGDCKQNIEIDSQRLSHLLNYLFIGPESIAELLNVLKEKGAEDVAKLFAEKLFSKECEKIIQLYHAVVEYLKKPELVEDYNSIYIAIENFAQIFKIQKKLDTSPYFGNNDPMDEKLFFEQ